MPEATVLYTVTAVVVLGLIVWVAAVLRTAREPWARPRVRRPEDGDGLSVVRTSSDPGAEGTGTEVDPAEHASTLDADSTAKATPVALASDGSARAAAKAEPDDDAKA